jgi:hypothetical protein
LVTDRRLKLPLAIQKQHANEHVPSDTSNPDWRPDARCCAGGSPKFHQTYKNVFVKINMSKNINT